MTVLNNYYFKSTKLAVRSTAYAMVTVLCTGFSVWAHLNWDLSFLWYDIKGYVIMIVYVLITLGMAISGMNDYKKKRMTDSGEPALTLADDRIIFTDNDLVKRVVKFEHCKHINFEHFYYFRMVFSDFIMKVQYLDDSGDGDMTVVKVDLNDIDLRQEHIEQKIKKAFNRYKTSRV